MLLADPFMTISFAHELFSSFKSKKGETGVTAVKLDLEKAFDLISWDYNKIVLHKFDFSSHWINLILECISSTSFSLLINGKTHGCFYPSRGIWQGDPYLPTFLFFVWNL